MNVKVTVRGQVARAAVRHATERMNALEGITNGPLTTARVVLTREPNPRIERRAHAVGEIVFAGHPLRAHVDARTMREAIDTLADRLARQLREHVDRLIAEGRSPRP